MFDVDFHRGPYAKGASPLHRETSQGPSFEGVLASARAHARRIRASYIAIRNDRGKVIGVFSTFGGDID